MKSVVFTYDPVGTLKSYDDGTTIGTYTYDGLNRKLTESVNFGTFSLGHSYTYYANGRKMSFTGPDGIIYDYSYDANNQLAGVAIPDNGFITYNYVWNRVAGVTLPGGTSRQYTYDPLMRIQSITAMDPGLKVVMDYRYNYDKMNNITAKQTGHGEYGYSYDELYRLTTAENPTLADETYSYDKVGNRLTAADVAGQYVYNQNNELLSVDAVAYGYDDNGNMLSKTVNGTATTFSYDIDNRLVRIEDNDVAVADYYYDPFGRRLWKDVGGSKTYFHYSDEGLVGEYDGGGVAVKTYGYRPDSTWSTDPLFMQEGDVYFFYHNDHLGTPIIMTDVNGAVVWAAVYDSFGRAVVDSASTVENNLRFPGQYYDSETGLHYNWHRYYDPSTGRYLTPDSIGLAGGINLYSYALQNPANYIDPNGLFGIIPGLRGKGPDWHHNRNIVQKGKCPAKEPLDKPCEWKSEGELWSHGWFKSYRGGDENTGYQCVYDSRGNLIDYPEFEGTYDISPPTSVEGFLGHLVLDFAPWLIWGN